MAEISEAGYENLRDAMEGNPLPWKYIELQTSIGTKITRRQIGLAGSGATLEAREKRWTDNCLQGCRQRWRSRDAYFAGDSSQVCDQGSGF